MSGYIPVLERLLCSIDEAGQVLGYGKTKVYELIDSGKIETVKPIGRTRVVVSSLKRLASPNAPAEKAAA